MQDDHDMIVVGRINGLFGVKGWVKVFSETRPRENILNYSPWYLFQDGEWQSFRLQDGKKQGKGIIASLENCSDRDTAAALTGTRIAISREQLPAAAEGEYYWSDLQGLKVINLDGTELGNVAEMMETGANDVMVVKDGAKRLQGEKAQERLIPFIYEQVVTKVDLEQGVLTVDWDPDF